MKINYITEGYFKNPEQARAARAKEEDNRAEIAKIANSMLEKGISEILNKAIALDESNENWYEGTVFNSRVFDRLFSGFAFSEKTLNGLVIPEARVKIEDDVIYIDFYFRINSDYIMKHFERDDVLYEDPLVSWSPSYFYDAFGPIETCPPRLKRTLGLPSRLKTVVENMKWCNKDKDLKSAWQFFIHTPTSKIKVNKIHMFTGCKGDVYISAMTAALEDLQESVKVANELISFENKGEIYFIRRIFSWDFEYPVARKEDEGRVYKIYKLEGNTLKEERVISK